MALLLARVQFATTSIYHFLFVPLTLGLSLLVAVMETMYVRTGNETYKKMTLFWGRLFLINFIMGVVTGIVQEFEFGMNWAGYARFVGNVFGAPLAVEALVAFFLESTFLGLWIFGWDKLSKKAHAATIWLVAVASSLSAFWILVANSFMQNPVGYAIQNGHAVMTSFGALITNPGVWYQFPHTVLAGFTTGAFFVMGISAYHLLRKRDADFFRRSFNLALVLGITALVLTMFMGDQQMRYVFRAQPMKAAAAEAVWNNAAPAPFTLVAGIDQANQTNSFALQIPAGLSLLLYGNTENGVTGIKTIQAQEAARYGPGNYIPPVAAVFWSFRIMVGAGSLMLLAVLLAWYFQRKGGLADRPWLLKALLWAVALPYIANIAGWVMTEVGRQPWIVYGLQTVQQAVSPNVSAGAVTVSLVGFTLLYGLLAVADIYLLSRTAREGPEGVAPKPAPVFEGVSLWN
ncbi:MAG: cytochrome ubiquinol oxidase subunit I [Peptococcaceae bacterium]|nr:cytochrome ubiquinol oxidase subunit I [Peptococcaceae bacterium]